MTDGSKRRRSIFPLAAWIKPAHPLQRPELQKHVTTEGDVIALETEDNKNDDRKMTVGPGAV